jgi:DeoR/GlpR family transcriptional regulator of sugar metabolism
LGKVHHLAERRQAILNALAEAGQLSVGELSARFNVSEVTIRMDLQALHEQNLVLRTRGGAVSSAILPEFSFDVRRQQNAERKARIGKRAAQLVHSGDSIALDASTTALSIIPYIKHLSELTVVTNSLKAAFSLLPLPRVHVIVPGGFLRKDSISLVGQFDQNLLKEIHVRIGFFGTRGATLERGLTDVNLDEVRAKRQLVGLCQTVVCVLDGRKWGQVAVATFADLEQIDQMITDESAPLDQVETFRKRGIEVHIV